MRCTDSQGLKSLSGQCQGKSIVSIFVYVPPQEFSLVKQRILVLHFRTTN